MHHASAICKSGHANHGYNASKDGHKGKASDPPVHNNKLEMGGYREICADMGQMEGSVQKIRETRKSEVLGRRQTGPVGGGCA